MQTKPVFLRAAWHNLIMANYVIDPEVLKPLVPARTELDFFRGKTYISMVGFRFLNTRILGIAYPFHRNFTEVNLRFYVRHQAEDGEWRRGTVFVSELVPKPLVAFLANNLYREQYAYAPMRHRIHSSNENLRIHYRWNRFNKWHHLYASAQPTSVPMQSGSLEEFIAEHYWGYNQYSKAFTMEYAVEHPRWRFFPVISFGIQANFQKLYGDRFAPFLYRPPVSVFVAQGSDVLIRWGNKLSASQFKNA